MVGHPAPALRSTGAIVAFHTDDRVDGETL